MVFPLTSERQQTAVGREVAAEMSNGRGRRRHSNRRTATQKPDQPGVVVAG